VTAAIDRAAPDDALIVTDTGHFHGIAASFIGPARARHFEVQAEFGAIAQGFGMAIGAALAAPERKVLFLSGDAGLMQGLQDLDTIGRFTPNVLTVVYNDESLGAEFHKLGAKGLVREKADYPSPDFAAIAPLLGVRGSRARSIEDIEQQVAAFLEGGGPALIGARISRRVVSRQYREEIMPQLAKHK